MGASFDCRLEQVSEYRQQRRDLHGGFESCNSTARYMDGYVDFGREVTTRAVRLRVVAQWTDNGERGSDGQCNDLGAGTIDATRCRVWGVAALQYLGGEPPVDSEASERLEVYDTSNACGAPSCSTTSVPPATPPSLTTQSTARRNPAKTKRTQSMNCWTN